MLNHYWWTLRPGTSGTNYYGYRHGFGYSHGLGARFAYGTGVGTFGLVNGTGGSRRC